MAYASLLSLNHTLDQVINILPPPTHHHVQSLLVSLQEKANFLLSLLDISSPKDGDQIGGLEGRIRDAAYQAEDIIIRSQQVSYQNQIIHSDSGVDEDNDRTDSHTSNQIVMELKYHQGLQKVIEELASVSEDLVKMKENDEIQLLRPTNSLPAASSRSTHSTPNSSLRVIGFDDEAEQILYILTSSYPNFLDVLPIVGMAGMGKTTLARLVYHHPVIIHYFEIRTWVTVSQEYREQEVLKGLLSSISDINFESGQEISTEKLAEKITKSLKDKRYLVVLDDVWDIQALNRLKRLFPDNNKRSRILLTTRLSHVAELASSTVVTHHLRFLSEDESQVLLQQKVFGEEECPNRFKPFLKKIVRVCGGLPLALVTVGGLLYKSERTVKYWVHIYRSIDSLMSKDRDNWMLNLRSFIYNHLPHHLKACLLYMGMLPEDHGIRRSKITKLWVANGFIRPDIAKTLEEVAEEYINDLIDRNLIIVHQWSFSGQIKSCNIHDVIRDFCVMKAKEEKFLQVVNVDPEFSNNMHHVSIQTDLKKCQIPRSALAHDFGLHVRSVVFFSNNNSNDVRDLISSFRVLRVLDVITIMFDKFPVEIVELVTLRSIFNTLFLPPEIWKMQRLRHLLFVRSFVPYPADVVNGENFVPLENLQTLSNVINFRWTKEVMEMIPNLKKLVITYEHDGRTEWSSYCFDNFVHLHQLQILKCYFFGKSYLKCQDPLPVNFAFPQKLRRLTISGCRMSWENITIVGSLPNLEVLKLKFHAFEGPLWESKEGEFCELKLLLIHMTDLVHWKADKTHFPRLERLSLRYCYSLEEIPSGIGKIPTLQEIEVCECAQSVGTSAEFIKKQKESLGNYDFQVVQKDEDTDVSR